MSSLQEAILHSEQRQAYLERIPNPARELVEQLILAFSGAMHFRMVPDHAQFLGDMMMANEKSFDAMSVNRDNRAALLELFHRTRETMKDIYDAVPNKMQQGRGFGMAGIPTWALCLRAEVHQLLNVITPAKRVAMVVDRELFNAGAVVDYANAMPESLQLSAIISPFHEVDEQIIDLLQRMEDLREYGEIFPQHHDDGSDTVDFFATGPCTDQMLYTHAAYDAAAIKGNEQERARYCREVLLPRILEASPDVVFLSNFKLILDECIPEILQQHGIKVINVHPSILPLNKGWRTEMKALEGIHPEASGCTFHYVTPDLDGGATLLTIPYPLIEYDPELAKGKKGEQYAAEREHLMRLLIIREQAKYTPMVLDLVTQNLPQKTVRNEEAFACEWRSRPEGFEGNYERVLFEVEGKWLTLEEILGRERIEIPESGVAPYRKYMFFLRRSENTERDVITLTDAVECGIGTSIHFHGQTHAQFGDGFYVKAETSAQDFAHILSGMNHVSMVGTEKLSVLSGTKHAPRKKPPK
ncbi:hypothetical protein COU78_05055 [Candidatus Peregrinibacteria bacterium CG10_big_fil_rev_8_21_14_0_10_49_24]|nr:MAG: hypothetical protein COV83_01425 [Candidatus Peregrinibacteria bacterium CG11_big_fil_rev_8_21_14_0_20_49_14]PIR50716.1 MAG: hypothetical protein COU78_05055 [Candidatus Peregrinibacteria bacterium CG10_big_fil_rev_8_21_14_0_10_49_24]PJA68240.1 MAG: hypothetical protein CO157_00755 [Candidatus Peregrinibacteria bacterium CG_4_9_14_3_um_filter_49_12]